MAGNGAAGGPVGVIGAGSWGTTLANLLAEKESSVELWVHGPELFQILVRRGENVRFLPGVPLNPQIRLTNTLADAVTGKRVLVCVVPSHAVRETFTAARAAIPPDALIVSATKGLEDKTLLTMSRVLTEVLGAGHRGGIAALSGPSFALEVSRGLPAAVSSAGETPDAARKTQEIFSRPYFRVYTNPDLMGVELGGAVKNVIAIAAGVSDGLGFGHSSRAALVTRGLAEMTRLGRRLGALPQTFAGLSGLGDLILTCTGDLSRNRRVGLEIGRGRSLGDILREMKMVAEGIRTTRALRDLARRSAVEMPITEKMYEILYEGKDRRESVEELMSRAVRSESERE
jgi:glycerol-3-phosphate dehydrogenase (NAD(P)+)